MRKIIEWYISDGKLFRKYREKIKKKKGEKEKERKKKHDFPPEARFLLEKSKRPTCCRDKQWHYGNPRRSTFSASRRIGSLASIRSFVRSLSLYETKFLEFFKLFPFYFLPWKIRGIEEIGYTFVVLKTLIINFDYERFEIRLWISNSRDDLTSLAA